MKAAELPGGSRPLLLAWFGGCALLGAGLLTLQGGDDRPTIWLAFSGGWGAIALALGVLLRKPRGAVLNWFANSWLLILAGALIWLWRSRNG